MIYLVGSNLDISNETDIQAMSVSDSKKLIRSWPVVQYDSETPGIDPRVVFKINAMQFGYKDYKTGKSDQVVVDCSNVSPAEYKEVIESSYLIGHNLKFDIKFLYNYSIIPRKVYDTMIIESLLYLGYSKKKITYNLHDVLFRHTSISLDKSLQKDISHIGVSTIDGVRYAAGDVVYLQDIRKSQMLIGESRKCLNAFTVENRFVPAIAYLEWCGVHLDEQKWRSKMSRDEAELKKTLDYLNNYVLSNDTLSEFVSTSSDSIGDNDNSPSLFSFEPSCIVDWNSPKQVAPVFKKLGFNTTVFDKDNGKDKDTVIEKVLSLQKGVNDEFLSNYFNYKGAVKAVTSYGQGHINQINPFTKRIHTEFRQIGTVTGRMASGSTKGNQDLAKVKKLYAKDVTFCNMQNLPARGEEGKIARACFTPMEGNVFVSCDYSAEESRVQADVWNEKSLLDSFEQGIDTHNLYAKLCFPEELKDVDVKDVKEKRPDLRQAAKSAEFALGYGSDGSAIAASIGMPKEKAREMVAGILKGMPGMAAFKKKTIKFLKEHGYIIINDITGHRIFWPEWAKWRAVEDSFDRNFWTTYSMEHQGTGDAVNLKVIKHRQESDEWFNKNVLNYPIQGGSAIVLKEAAANLFDWVVDNGYFNKVLFCVFVHDEIDCECPEEIKDKFSNALKTIMEKSAAKYYKRLKIPAEVSAGDHWIH